MINIHQHFEQQLIVERWSADRGYFIDDTPDFVDYLSRFKGAITNFGELDLYYTWYRQ